MTGLMKLSFILFVLLLLTAPLFAGEIEDTIRNAPDASQYKDANALILSSLKSYDLLEGKKSLEASEYIVKVLNNRGRSKYSDQKVSFNTEKDRLILINAGTYTQDLSFVAIEKKAINDVTPLELEGAQIYAVYLNRVFSFPVVDPGATLFMHYQKATDLKDDDNISDRVYMQLDEPLLYKKLKITVPPSRQVVYRVEGFNGTLLKGHEKDRDTYTLEVRDVPMVKPEERMPPFSEVARNVLFSTARSWDEATLPFSKEFYLACRLTPEITSCAQELTKTCKSREEKLMAVSMYMAQQVRSVDIDFGDVGYKPHPATEVLKNKYGDCRDKTVLMVALLKACGIASYPALINGNDVPIAKDIPALNQFDYVLVAIPEGKGFRCIDPSGEMSQFGFVATNPDSETLIVEPDRRSFSPLVGYSPIESRAVNSVEGVLGENGDFRGTIVSDLSGTYDISARYGLYHLLQKKLQMYFEEKADEFCPESQVKDASRTDPFDLTRNMKVSLSIDSPHFAVTQGNLMIINIPELPFSFAQHPYAPSLTARKYPYELGTCNEWSYSFKMKIPEGYKLMYAPKSLTVEKEYGTFTLLCESNTGTNELLLTKKLRITRNRVSAADYPEFKKNLERLALTQNNMIILQK